jgi:hypothetical protein
VKEVDPIIRDGGKGVRSPKWVNLRHDPSLARRRLRAKRGREQMQQILVSWKRNAGRSTIARVKRIKVGQKSSTTATKV